MKKIYRVVVKLTIILMGAVSITACGITKEINNTTAIIKENQEAVRSSSEDIIANSTAVRHSTEIIENNKYTILDSTQAIAQNREAILKTTEAILSNGEVIENTTALIAGIGGHEGFFFIIGVIVIALFLLPMIVSIIALIKIEVSLRKLGINIMKKN